MPGAAMNRTMSVCESAEGCRKTLVTSSYLVGAPWVIQAGKVAARPRPAILSSAAQALHAFQCTKKRSKKWYDCDKSCDVAEA